MSSGTKVFLAVSWTVAGAGIAILGEVIGVRSLILPGLLLAVLGLALATHIGQDDRFKNTDAQAQVR